MDKSATSTAKKSNWPGGEDAHAVVPDGDAPDGAKVCFGKDEEPIFISSLENLALVRRQNMRLNQDQNHKIYCKI